LFVRVRGLNETKTFGVIEKFYCSLHFVMFYKSIVLRCSQPDNHRYDRIKFCPKKSQGEV